MSNDNEVLTRAKSLVLSIYSQQCIKRVIIHEKLLYWHEKFLIYISLSSSHKQHNTHVFFFKSSTIYSLFLIQPVSVSSFSLYVIVFYVIDAQGLLYESPVSTRRYNLSPNLIYSLEWAKPKWERIVLLYLFCISVFRK